MTEKDGAKYFRANRPTLLVQFEKESPRYWINALADLDSVLDQQQ